MTKVRPKKQLGQHFLVDEHYARRVADLSDAFSSGHLLEIGPGMGVLTKYLAQKQKELKVIEVDRDSVAYLKSHMPEIQVISGDFLKYNLDDTGWGDLAVIGNFPYNISSQIIFRTLENRHKITDIAGMFQLEVAERLVAKTGNKVYGILSVLLRAFYEAEIAFKIPPGVFNPPPKVMSAAIVARRREHFTLNCDEKLFFNVVKTCFNHRRKTIANNLGKFNIPRDLVLQNQFAKLRAENLDVDSYVELTRFVSEQMKS